MEIQFTCLEELRFSFLEKINLFHDADEMRLRSVDLVSSQWEIAYVAGRVFSDRAAEILDSLGGMAGEW